MDSITAAPLANYSADDLQSPDIYRNCFDHVSDYVLIFNQDLRAIYTNRTCLEFLDKPRSTNEFLVGREFCDFAPDYRNIESWNRFMSLSAPSDSYSLDEYYAIGTIFRHPLYCKVQLLRNKDLLCAIVTETTEDVIKNDALKRQAVRLAEIEDYCNKLKNTIDVLIDRNKEKENEKSFIYNLEKTVFPILDMLKSSQLDEHQLALLDVLYANLNSPIDSFFQKHSVDGLNAREAQIVNLIWLGKSTKDIANLLCLSTKTVEYHRANIRKKLNISKTSIDLGNFLHTLVEN